MPDRDVNLIYQNGLPDPDLPVKPPAARLAAPNRFVLIQQISGQLILCAGAADARTLAHGPYRFQIDHDVSAAACRSNRLRTGSCPLRYDWIHGHTVGITTTNRAETPEQIAAENKRLADDTPF